MLSYYVQLREHMRSSMNDSAKPEPEANRREDLRHPVCGDTSPEHLTELVVPTAPAREAVTPAEAGDLDDVFEAMTEEFDFDLPEFSPVDRIKSGLIESTIGLVLFLALVVGAAFLHQSFGHHQP